MNQTVVRAETAPAAEDRRVPRTSEPRSPGRQIRSVLLVLVLLSLIASNVLSLVSDSFHTRAYLLVSSILPSSMLAKSPTVVRRREADIATAALTMAKQAAERSAADAAVEVASLTASAAAKTQLIKRISTSIARRTVTNVERNVSSVAGEALPYLGTAFVVGVTLWDVKDACDTLSQLDQLNAGASGSTASAETTKVCGTQVPAPAEVKAQLESNWQAVYEKTAAALNQGMAVVPSVPNMPSLGHLIGWLKSIFHF